MRSGISPRSRSPRPTRASRSSVDSRLWSGYCTRTTAIRPSAETRPPRTAASPPRSSAPAGSLVPSTCGSRLTSACSRASAVRAVPWSKNVAPPSTGVTTTWAVIPSWPVPARSISSAARWESSPGAVIESAVGPPKAIAATTASAAASSHAAITRHGWRAALPPRRERAFESIWSSNHLVGRLRTATDAEVRRGGAPGHRLASRGSARPRTERRSVLLADARRGALPRLKTVLRDDLRILWTEPRPPDAPGRVWRDWALLAAGLGGVVLEATLREDVVWRPVAVVFAVWLSGLPMWRRTRPLAMVALGFGAMILLEVASLVAAPREPVGLYTGAVVLGLVYALPRWGSGREVVLGGVVILAAFALSVVTDDTPAVDQVVGLAFLLPPAVIGASVRFRATARERQLERVRSRERERLARELHDAVAHHVSAMVIRAQAGRVVAGTDPAAAIEALEGVEEDGARTLEEMRAMVAALRDGGAAAELAPPAGVVDLGLDA